jgi:hypothetical protein
MPIPLDQADSCGRIVTTEHPEADSNSGAAATKISQEATMTEVDRSFHMSALSEQRTANFNPSFVSFACFVVSLLTIRVIPASQRPGEGWRVIRG